jgi:transcriptional regulator GlxA family with amidase domain
LIRSACVVGIPRGRFVSATGMKPSEYQQRLRVFRAREMLEFSRTSVDEIAASVGYDDVGGF